MLRTKIYLLAIMINLSFSSDHVFGQKVELLPTENAHWEYEVWDPGRTTWHHQYIVGEEEIENKTYTKFKIDNYQTSWDWPYYIDTIKYGSKVVNIRIDSGCIFKYDYTNGEELIFNSKWKEGDSIIVKDEPIDSIRVVLYIDTIYYGNSPYKRWNFSIPPFDNVNSSFIAGIGSTVYPIDHSALFYYWEGSGSLECFSQNGEKLIDNGCNKSVGLELRKNREDIKIYPNPTSSHIFLHFESQTNEKLVIKLFDTKGNMIYINTLNKNNHEIIFPKELSGLYILEISSKNSIWNQNVIFK